jgi:hypothetical protein
VDYGAGGDPQSIVVADFNGDGKLDIAVNNAHTAPGISVLSVTDVSAASTGMAYRTWPRSP